MEVATKEGPTILGTLEGAAAARTAAVPEGGARQEDEEPTPGAGMEAGPSEARPRPDMVANDETDGAICLIHFRLNLFLLWI